jgi:methylisocitrate lyase
VPYLVADDLPSERPGARLRALLARPGIVPMPGAHNGMAALQARDAGFDALYLSGAAMSASMGLPDLGIITIDDVCFFIRQVARAGLPVLVDGDTGYGEALNVMQMVRAFEAAGAAAVHIEDQQLPKKCGHLNDKRLVSADDMVLKVAAARKAATDLVVVARTDAVASEGLSAAIARAERYVAAGAEVVFPEALTTPAMFREFAAALPGVPLLANMTEFGRTPMLSAAEFEELGYKVVIWPVTSLRMANKAQAELYATLRAAGSAQALLPRMQTRAELYATIDLEAYEALDAAIVRTVLPS